MRDDDKPTVGPSGRRDDEPGPEQVPLKVEDRRHWARQKPAEEEEQEAAPTHPAVVEEYRQRAEAAEDKLLEYIAAFKASQAEHEQFRERLARDVDRRVDLKFGALVTDLLECLDDLDLALSHIRRAGGAEALAEGVALARERFLGALQRHGVEPIHVDGEPFDPNVAEAVRMDPVDDPALDGRVVSTERAGFRLGDRVIRPARVAVGKVAP